MNAVIDRIRERLGEHLHVYLKATQEAGRPIPDMRASEISLEGRIEGEPDDAVVTLALDVTLPNGYSFTVRAPTSLAELIAQAKAGLWLEPEDEVVRLLGRLH